MCDYHRRNCKHVKPERPGPYDVGFCEQEVELTNGVSKVVVWYPIKQGYCPRYLQETLDASNTYQITENSFFTGFEDAACSVRSHLKALQDADIACGQFPLSTYSHGGGGTSIKNSSPYWFARTNEHLASHGVIAVGYTRPTTDPEPAGEDLSSLITYLTSQFKFRNSVDKNKIVVMGTSNGTFASMAAAGAWPGITKDPRVKGLINLEGIISTDVPGSWVNLDIPSMVFGRRAVSPYEEFYDYDTTLDVATQSNPRHYIRIDGATHLGIDAANADILNSCREVSLASGTNTDPLVFPLGSDRVDPYGDSYFFTLDPNGRLAYSLWNLPIFFGLPADYTLELGLAPNNITGVGSNYINSDKDNDGFVDVPKYITGTASAGSQTSITLESNVQVVNGFPMNQNQYDTPGSLDGFEIQLTGGAGEFQGRKITCWTGAPHYVAVVSEPWETQPDETTVYVASNQQGAHRRAYDGTYVDNGRDYLGLEELNKLINIYTVSFIKSVICKDKSYSKFLNECNAEELKSAGLTSLRVEGEYKRNCHCHDDHYYHHSQHRNQSRSLTASNSRSLDESINKMSKLEVYKMLEKESR